MVFAEAVKNAPSHPLRARPEFRKTFGLKIHRDSQRYGTGLAATRANLNS
jgi:hypothetical protein